jgi:hypothetical protein
MRLPLVPFLIFCAVPALFAQRTAAVFPRIEPDPAALAFAARGARSGGYSWTDLAEISLWASGDTAITANLERIRKAAADLQASPELPAAARDRAEYILGFMHTNLLKAYSLNQTRMDTLLANGRYNCVSSAALYIILAKACGLDVAGVMTKDHAFAVTYSGGEAIDVETTNAYGFDPGRRQDFHDQFGKVTGFAYVPARNYRDRQTITPVELVSLILSNRIAELETHNRFAEAVPLAVDRAALFSHNGPAAGTGGNEQAAPFFEDPRRDLMNRLFNYSAFLLRSGREEDCLRWAQYASAVYPYESRWQESILAAVNNRIQKLVNSGQLAAARTFLDSQKNALSAANYAALDVILLDNELVNSASRIKTAEDGDRVIAAIEQARGGGRMPAGRAVELFTFAVQKTAAALSAAPGRDWLSAINYIQAALARSGPNRELEQSLQTYRSNRASEFHNRFASAWNSKQFDEARRILTAGLAEFPDNRQLLADKKVFE